MIAEDIALDYLKGLKYMFINQKIRCVVCGFFVNVEGMVDKKATSFKVFCPRCGTTQREKIKHHG